MTAPSTSSWPSTRLSRTSRSDCLRPFSRACAERAFAVSVSRGFFDRVFAAIRLGRLQVAVPNIRALLRFATAQTQRKIPDRSV